VWETPKGEIMGKKYYIQNVDRGLVGNCLVWWGKNDMGYVLDIRKAGVYSEEEAKKRTNDPHITDKMWEKDYGTRRFNCNEFISIKFDKTI
jgi:hypothetical protein